MRNSSRDDKVGRVRAVYFFFKENSIFFYNAIFYFTHPVFTPVDFNVSDVKHLLYTSETSLAWKRPIADSLHVLLPLLSVRGSQWQD